MATVAFAAPKDGETPLHIHLHIHEADAENHSPHSEMGISNFTDLHASLAATSSSGADPRSMEDDLSTVAEPTTSMAGVPLQHSEMETSYSTESCAFSATTCLVGSAPLSVAGDLNTEVEPAISTGAAHADHDSGQCVNARREHYPEHLVYYPIRQEQTDNTGCEMRSNSEDRAPGDDSGLLRAGRREHEPGETSQGLFSVDEQGVNQRDQGLCASEEGNREKRRKLRSEAREATRTCGWQVTAVAQLQHLRLWGRGWEPMWLGVLRRIVHRQDPVYERWCREYLKPLRSEFAARMCHELHVEPLHAEERKWAAQVEFATFQDYGQAGHVHQAVVVGPIPHLPEDDKVPAKAASQPRTEPLGIVRPAQMKNDAAGGSSSSASTSQAAGVHGTIALGEGQRGDTGVAKGPAADEEDSEVLGLFQLET